MMYKIKVSKLAHRDLEQIVSYLLVNLDNPTSATRLLDKIEVCYGYLKRNPYMYAICENAGLEKEGYRKILISNYVLIYKIDESSKKVNVMRFFYGAQDYFKII